MVSEGSICDLSSEIDVNQERDDKNNADKTSDGRYPCRFQGCNATFKYDGLSRKKHEVTHNLPPENPDLCEAKSSTKDEKNDDIYNYNCAFLEDGLFFLNFLDAVSEGDGLRIMRQYKYLLMSFRADGQQSSKYALECLYQSFLVNSLLCRRDAERFVWNTSVNTFGGKGNNIALDLDMEHSNRFVKQAIRNLGPNITGMAVSRICNAESGIRKMVNKLDKCLHRNPVSGRHPSATGKDLAELISRTVSTDVYSRHDCRKYNHFTDFERDLLRQLDMSSMYKWINKHKKNIIQGVRAR